MTTDSDMTCKPMTTVDVPTPVTAEGTAEVRPYYVGSMPNVKQLWHPTYGLPAASYPVKDDQNQIVFVISEFDGPEGTKSLVPRTYGELNGEIKWHNGAPRGYSA